MKKTFILFLIISSALSAQFKEESNKTVDLKKGMINNSPSSLFLDFLNPNNFSMNHSFSLSYSGFSGGGMALGVYTNSLAYKIADNFNIEADISLVNSPYNTFGKEFTDQLNGVYLSRLEMNYKPSDNFRVVLQYQQIPMNSYSPYRYSPYWGNSFFGNSLLEKD